MPIDHGTGLETMCAGKLIPSCLGRIKTGTSQIKGKYPGAGERREPPAVFWYQAEDVLQLVKGYVLISCCGARPAASSKQYSGGQFSIPLEQPPPTQVVLQVFGCHAMESNHPAFKRLS
jgi:hypothetical protein